MRILEDINEVCLLVNYIKAEVADGFKKDQTEACEAGVESKIAVLCKENKEHYLNTVKNLHQKYYKSIPTEEDFSMVRNESDLDYLYGERDRLWEQLWSNLEPDQSRNLLRYVPKIDVQLLDHSGMNWDVTIKIEGMQEQASERCIVVNHMHVYFGTEIQLSDKDREKRWDYKGLPCIVKDYFIKNTIAMLCDNEKQEYLDRINVVQQEYLNEARDRRDNNRESFKEWIKSKWNSLKPSKNLINKSPTLDVYHLVLNDDPLYVDSTRIELKGEIDYRWTLLGSDHTEKLFS